MKFLADECCDSALVTALRSDGYDVTYVIEGLRGDPDDDILQRAYAEDRILITEDKDFGELVYRLRKPAKGVILLRFDVSERTLKIPRLHQLLKMDSHRLDGAFIVLEANKYRVRLLTRS